jgi:hypothetical protein
VPILHALSPDSAGHPEQTRAAMHAVCPTSRVLLMRPAMLKASASPIPPHPVPALPIARLVTQQPMCAATEEPAFLPVAVSTGVARNKQAHNPDFSLFRFDYGIFLELFY